MLNEAEKNKEKEKLVQVVNMAIDTRDYFAIRSRLQSYLDKEETPTIENFADYLYGLGDRNLGNIVMEHANRAGL